MSSPLRRETDDAWLPHPTLIACITTTEASSGMASFGREARQVLESCSTCLVNLHKDMRHGVPS
eukprot:scaffold2127_cov136-Pinguiococcus_pyrenoidosus.AAC.1